MSELWVSESWVSESWVSVGECGWVSDGRKDGWTFTQHCLGGVCVVVLFLSAFVRCFARSFVPAFLRSTFDCSFVRLCGVRCSTVRFELSGARPGTVSVRRRVHSGCWGVGELSTYSVGC